MKAVRTSPVLVAAAAFALGDAAGIAREALARAAGKPPPADLLPLALAACLLLWAAMSARSSPHRGGTFSTRAALLACVAAAALCGVSIGGRAARGARDACVSTLRTGQAAEAVGRLRTALRPPESGAVLARRAALVGASLRMGGRRCLLRSLSLRVRGGPRRVEAGEAVLLRGEWLRFAGSDGLMREPERMGALEGRLVLLGDHDVPQMGGPSWLSRVRARLSGTLYRRLAPDVRAAGAALLLAERDQIDPEVARRFASAGLAHLLAISGLHVALVASALLWLAGVFIPGSGRLAAAAAAVGTYVLMIGAPPAASRAAWMFGGYAATRLRGRPARMGDLIGVAGGIGLLFRPLLVLDVGFQLSFAGLAGLLIGGTVGTRIAERAVRSRGRAWPRRVRRLAIAFVAGLGAFAATAPIVAARFGRVSPVAVVSHFVGVPLVGVALPALAGAALLPSPGGELSGAAATGILRLLFHIIDLFARLPLGHMELAPPGPAGWLTILLTAVGALRLAGRGSPWRALVPVGAAVGWWLAAPAVAGRWLTRGQTLLCTLDVGQGDAAVLRTRSGHWLVFDAGPRRGSWDAGRRVVVPFLASHGASEVEMFILSHPHQDHLGGAGALMDAFRVRRVLDAGNPLGAPLYLRFLSRVEGDGTEWMTAVAGDRFAVDEVSLEVLAPSAAESRNYRRQAVEANEASVAFRLTVGGGFTYLNVGDASGAEEARLLHAWPLDSLRSDLLKVAHHGSRSSTNRHWLDVVRPRVAVISAGAHNRYGHPHPGTLARLDAAGVSRVWRTDRDGTLCVRIRADGQWRIVGSETRWRGGS